MHPARTERRIAAAHAGAKSRHPVSPAVSAVPGMIEISRSDREPANASEAEARSKSKSKSDSESESDVWPKPEERNVSRRPHWVISRIPEYRPGPPAPATAIHEPPSVVIRSPSPRFVRYPRPSVVRLVSPPSVTIRNPVWSRRGHPNVSVIRHVLPVAVSIQILRSNVVPIGVLPAHRLIDVAIAVAVPLIPLIAYRSVAGLILRIVRPSNCNHLAGRNARAALLRADIGLAAHHNHASIRIRADLHSEDAIAGGMHRHIGSVDFRLRFAAGYHAQVHHSQPQLHLDMFARKVHNFGVSVLVHAQNVCEVQFHLRAPARASGDAVARDDRGIHRCGGPVRGVVMLGRDVAVNQADAAHARRRRRIGLAVRGIRLRIGGIRLRILRARSIRENQSHRRNR